MIIGPQTLHFSQIRSVLSQTPFLTKYKRHSWPVYWVTMFIRLLNEWCCSKVLHNLNWNLDWQWESLDPTRTTWKVTWCSSLWNSSFNFFIEVFQFFTRLLPFLFNSWGHGGIRHHFVRFSFLVDWENLQTPSTLEGCLHGRRGVSISDISACTNFPRWPAEHEVTQQRCLLLWLNTGFSSVLNSKDSSCRMPVSSSLVLNSLVLWFLALKGKEVFQMILWRFDLKYMWGVS